MKVEVMKIAITVPDEYTGDVMGDMNKRRGRISEYNDAIRKMAMEEGVFYLDVSQGMEDAQGYLPDEASREMVDALEGCDKTVIDSLQQNITLYDKNGEMHYDIISAFIKSIRGSDPNAAVYYLAKMLENTCE